MNITQTPTRTEFAVLLASGLLLAPFLAWSAFVFPTADDLSVVAWREGGVGLAETLTSYYLNNGGQVTAVALRWLHSPLTLSGYYRLSPLLAIAMHLLAAYAAGTLLFPNIRRLSRFAGALAWTGLYIGSMPSIASSLYWATGMIAYEPGNCTWLLLLSLIAVGGHRSSLRGLLCGIGLVLFATTMHFPFLMAVGATITAAVLTPGRRKSDFVLWIFWASAAAFVLSAPGNFVRQETLSGGSSLNLKEFVVACGRAVFSYWQFVAAESQSLAIWLIGLLATAFAPLGRKRPVVGWTTLVLMQTAVFGTFVLSAVAGADPPFERTRNALHFLNLGTAAIVVPKLLTNSKKVSELLDVLESPRWLFIVLCTVFSLLPNVPRGVRELIGSAKEHRAFWDGVVARADEARRTNGVLLIDDTLAPKPVTVFHPSHLKSDPEEWPNASYGRYFGVSDVSRVAIEDTDSSP